MIVRDLANARSGDKGDVSNLIVVARSDEAFQHLLENLTCEKVLRHFEGIAHGPARRYEIPHLRVLNFVLERALDGGVTRTLRQDIHGKSLSSHLLTLEL